MHLIASFALPYPVLNPLAARFKQPLHGPIADFSLKVQNLPNRRNIEESTQASGFLKPDPLSSLQLFCR